jgi:hypothetical protein
MTAGPELQPGSYDFQPHEVQTQVHRTTVDINMGGYQTEQYKLDLKKTLSVSTDGVGSNLLWHKDRKYLAYSSESIVIIEDLN